MLWLCESLEKLLHKLLDKHACIYLDSSTASVWELSIEMF